MKECPFLPSRCSSRSGAAPQRVCFPPIHSTGTVPVWSDYFIHGAQIAQFGDRMATGRASFDLSDQPIGLYHFAPYMLPAAVSTLVDLPSLGLASSVLFPYGILVASLGAYILARTLAGRSFALLVPFTLLLLPDASTHGLRNGFFSFHWFLGATPGSGHATGSGVHLAGILCTLEKDRARGMSMDDGSSRARSFPDPRTNLLVVCACLSHDGVVGDRLRPAACTPVRPGHRGRGRHNPGTDRARTARSTSMAPFHGSRPVSPDRSHCPDTFGV